MVCSPAPPPPALLELLTAPDLEALQRYWKYTGVIGIYHLQQGPAVCCYCAEYFVGNTDAFFDARPFCRLRAVLCSRVLCSASRQQSGIGIGLGGLVSRGTALWGWCSLFICLLIHVFRRRPQGKTQLARVQASSPLSLLCRLTLAARIRPRYPFVLGTVLALHIEAAKSQLRRSSCCCSWVLLWLVCWVLYCFPMSCHVVPGLPWHTLPAHVLSCHVFSCLVMSYLITLCLVLHILSCLSDILLACRVMPCHALSCHVVYYFIFSCHFLSGWSTEGREGQERTQASPCLASRIDPREPWCIAPLQVGPDT